MIPRNPSGRSRICLNAIGVMDIHSMKSSHGQDSQIRPDLERREPGNMLSDGRASIEPWNVCNSDVSALGLVRPGTIRWERQTRFKVVGGCRMVVVLFF